jgi:hypothetical protein
VNGSKVDTRNDTSVTHAHNSTPKKRLLIGVAALFIAGGSIIAGNPAPAKAALVYNMMLCEPDTGWCFQTNPPYVPGIQHECQWDYKLDGNNLRSGMWYTGCNVWWPKIT